MVFGDIGGPWDAFGIHLGYLGGPWGKGELQRSDFNDFGAHFGSLWGAFSSFVDHKFKLYSGIDF